MSQGHKLSRRSFLASASAAAVTARLTPMAKAGAYPGEAVAGEVELHWLDGAPAASLGTSWGVPWLQGRVPAHTTFALRDSTGSGVPLQSWPLAYWPDGTLKWTGHAVTSAALAERYTLAPGMPSAPAQPVTATRSGREVRLSNGVVDVLLATSGPLAISSISRAERVTARNGRLVLQLQDKPDDRAGPRHTSWSGVVESTKIEQSGPVRAVVQLSGHYREDSPPRYGTGHRTILPWTMRIYLCAGDESIRLVHHFVWDGDVNRDFIRGLGLQLDVPMSDQPYDRHVRFAGPDRGVWGEPVLVLTGLRRDSGDAVRTAQVAGTATPPVAQWPATVQAGYQDLPLWGDFTLAQHAATHCAVWKRTSDQTSWLKHAGFADRAPGFGYAGGVSGGLGFGLRDFWQRFPRALDVRDAAKDTATVTLW